jgi:carbon storage regulator
MLLLSRRVGETICIGDDITVTVTRCHGNQVRLAIQAPNSVEIHREEIYKRVKAERAARAASPAS